jgi:hypothetical protein
MSVSQVIRHCFDSTIHPVAPKGVENQLLEKDNKISSHLDPQTLESQNSDICCDDLDVSKERFLDDFLDPNETNVLEVKPHLKKMKEGLAVSVGLQRTFFSCILADPKKMTGLILTDINPNLVLVARFIILCFKLLTRDEFNHLLDVSSIEKNRLSLKEKLIHSKMDETFKNYYTKNFDRLFDTFFRRFCYKWKNSFEFNEVNYCKNPHQYQLLQSYATSGKICAVCDEIMSGKKLQRFKKDCTLIDVSNVPYAFGGSFSLLENLGDKILPVDWDKKYPNFRIDWCKKGTLIISTRDTKRQLTNKAIEWEYSSDLMDENMRTLFLKRNSQ